MSNGLLTPALRSEATPAEAAERLRATSALTLASSDQTATLSFANGLFVLGWSAKDIDSHDWVALYLSISAADDDYLTYQWATRGPSYTTSQVVQAGCQARYLVWKVSSGRYGSVAKTDPFPLIRVCSP